jgi:starch synthase
MIPSIFTIHNGQYHGAFSWEKSALLPWYDANSRGLLDWSNTINPLATGIKCCWKLTTVSNGYLHELQYQAAGLESLIRQESAKSTGIVNGIDTQVWNPATDPMIDSTLTGNIAEFKLKNRIALKNHFNIQNDLPLITFIGRLVYEKGVDLLPEAIYRFISEGGKASFVILGTGDPGIRDAILNIQKLLGGFIDTSIQYNEKLSHQLYAGSDFLIMPSRVEPCGLNQLYAFRYGTIPIVRNTGGLAETVKDISEENGNGIKFNHADPGAISHAFHRAAELFNNQDKLNKKRQQIVDLDFSWKTAAKHYLHIYYSVKQPSV